MPQLAPLLLIAGLLAACGSTPEAQPVADGALDAPTAKAMLAAHNRWRGAIPVPPLRWSVNAAQQAEVWARQLAAEDCMMRHNPDPARRRNYGENIYAYWRSSAYTGFRRAPDLIVDRWGDEGRWYDDASHTCDAPAGKSCGHYTQLVWRYSKFVGCARARCAASEVWVCNYSPRGNYIDVDPY